MRTIFLSLLILVLAVSACAQQPQAPPPPPPMEDEEAPQPPPGERENVRFFLAYKMKERLNLTEAQTLKVLEILKEGDQLRLAHRESMRNMRSTAYKLLQNPKATDAEFRKMAEDMTRAKKDSEAGMDELDKKLMAVFTPKQQLEWLLFKREMQTGGCPGPGQKMGAPGKQRGQRDH
ncbi:MAG TPA: hypothetical protein PKJ37_07120 [Acidobacteriota bacterium]|nr:hypothetical protein [Acidobacteriota bacterium]